MQTVLPRSILSINSDIPRVAGLALGEDSRGFRVDAFVYTLNSPTIPGEGGNFVASFTRREKILPRFGV